MNLHAGFTGMRPEYESMNYGFFTLDAVWHSAVLCTQYVKPCPKVDKHACLVHVSVAWAKMRQIYQCQQRGVHILL